MSLLSGAKKWEEALTIQVFFPWHEFLTAFTAEVPKHWIDSEGAGMNAEQDLFVTELP